MNPLALAALAALAPAVMALIAALIVRDGGKAPYVGHHWAHTVHQAQPWYHPLYNRELGQLLDGDARWMVSA